jgi:hypothetical protein
VTSEMKSPLGPPIQATRNRIEMNPAAKIQPRVCLVPQFGICNRHSLLILVGWDFVRYPGASEISRASASNTQASPSSFCSKIERPLQRRIRRRRLPDRVISRRPKAPNCGLSRESPIVGRRLSCSPSWSLARLGVFTVISLDPLS